MFGKKKDRYDVNADVRETFLFLEREGFKVTKYQKNSELEYVYKLKGCVIEIFIDAFSSSSDVVVSNKNERSNIFYCKFFDEAKRTELMEKRNLGIAKGNLPMQLKLYGEFLKENTKCLISDNF